MVLVGRLIWILLDCLWSAEMGNTIVHVRRGRGGRFCRGACGVVSRGWLADWVVGLELLAVCCCCLLFVAAVLRCYLAIFVAVALV